MPESPARDVPARDAAARGEPVRVRVDRHGPTYVDGPVEISVDGEEPFVVDRFRVAICSCRGSAQYPLCDGTHNRILGGLKRARNADRT